MMYLLNENYASAQKNTRNINIFEKSFVIIPIHSEEKKHWSLAIICGLDTWVKQIRNSNEIEAEDIINNHQISIYFMDSLYKKDVNYEIFITKFLALEFKTQEYELYCKITFPNSISFPDLKINQLALPKQKNSFDCGIFLLEYVEGFFEKLEENMKKLDIEDYNFENLFPFRMAEEKRKILRIIISKLRHYPLNEVVAMYKEFRERIKDESKQFFKLEARLPQTTDDSCIMQKKTRGKSKR